MEKESDSIVIQKALRILQNIFNDCLIPDLVEAVVTRWASDEFSRGSYSFVANGSTGYIFKGLN